MATPIRPELLARFGNDPDALEWARGVVQESVDLLVAALESPDATGDMCKILGWAADFMTKQLIGGTGEISRQQPLGRFDARLAETRPGQED